MISPEIVQQSSAGLATTASTIRCSIRFSAKTIVWLVPWLTWADKLGLPSALCSISMICNRSLPSFATLAILIRVSCDSPICLPARSLASLLEAELGLLRAFCCDRTWLGVIVNPHRLPTGTIVPAVGGINVPSRSSLPDSDGFAFGPSEVMDGVGPVKLGVNCCSNAMHSPQGESIVEATTANAKRKVVVEHWITSIHERFL